MCQIVISAPAILWLTNCVILNKSDKSCKNFENINTYIHEYINWRIDPCIAYMISSYLSPSQFMVETKQWILWSLYYYYCNCDVVRPQRI